MLLYRSDSTASSGGQGVMKAMQRFKIFLGQVLAFFLSGHPFTFQRTSSMPTVAFSLEL